MFVLTHNSLENLKEWFDTTPIPKGKYDEHSKINRYLSQLVVESKFIYSITLRYPTTNVDRDAINWMIKNTLPSPTDLAKFHETLGY